MPMQQATRNKTASVMGAAALGVLAMVAAFTGAASAAPGTDNPLVCEARKGAGDVVDHRCPVVATGAAQRFRLSATFEGSHDDTKLAMKPTLDGTAIVCEPGSKTSSLFEDGDVALECRFQITAKAGTKMLLAVRLQWYHAQLVKTVFVSE